MQTRTHFPLRTKRLLPFGPKSQIQLCILSLISQRERRRTGERWAHAPDAWDTDLSHSRTTHECAAQSADPFIVWHTNERQTPDANPHFAFAFGSSAVVIRSGFSIKYVRRPNFSDQWVAMIYSAYLWHVSNAEMICVSTSQIRCRTETQRIE